MNLIELSLELRKSRELNPELLLDVAELIVYQREDIFAARQWTYGAAFTPLAFRAALSNRPALATVPLLSSAAALA